MPITLPQAVQEMQPDQKHIWSSSMSSQLYLGYVHSHWQNSVRKTWLFGLFFFFFLCWERENREKKRWREKDASCWCLLVHSSSLGSHSVSTGKAYTTIPQSTSCGYGFCDELTLSDFLYFSHKHDQILLCLATQNRDPHPMPVYRQQIIT